jgi:hypothetical protein
MRIDAFKAGLVFGAFLALWHACWSALVALGWAQALINFVLWVHFLSLPLKVEPFDITRAVILVGITFAIGFAMGCILALLWNVSVRRFPTGNVTAGAN